MNKMKHNIGIVTQTGPGIPNNESSPEQAVAHQPPTKGISIDASFLRKNQGGSAHSVNQLKDMRGR